MSGSRSVACDCRVFRTDDSGLASPILDSGSAHSPNEFECILE